MFKSLIIATTITLVCGCAYAGGKNDMKTLKIKWQRLISNEQTCPRCGSTETELEKAVSTLKAQGINVVLEKEELSLGSFKKDPSQSNRIWINDRPLEQWLNAEAGKSVCRDVCGDSECRTVVVDKQSYESVPADLIIKAGLAAVKSNGGCCPK